MRTAIVALRASGSVRRLLSERLVAYGYVTVREIDRKRRRAIAVDAAWRPSVGARGRNSALSSVQDIRGQTQGELAQISQQTRTPPDKLPLQARHSRCAFGGGVAAKDLGCCMYRCRVAPAVEYVRASNDTVDASRVTLAPDRQRALTRHCRGSTSKLDQSRTGIPRGRRSCFRQSSSRWRRGEHAAQNDPSSVWLERRYQRDADKDAQLLVSGRTTARFARMASESIKLTIPTRCQIIDHSAGLFFSTNGVDPARARPMAQPKQRSTDLPRLKTHNQNSAAISPTTTCHPTSRSTSARRRADGTS